MEGLVDSFWKGKKVFVTGHTGFKGGWLVQSLKLFGAEVKGYSLPPNTSPDFFSTSNVINGIHHEIGDIRNYSEIEKSILSFNPEIIFHLAAQPLVRYSYKHPKETYEVNLIGTLNLLEVAKKVGSLKAMVVITTDKCYSNIEDYSYAYKETDPMGGYDPYSSSKACCELLISSYRNCFFKSTSIKVASARAGNVIGGGDWSEDRLIPDILKAINSNYSPKLRNPLAIRPWQHVLEPVHAYLKLAKLLYEGKDGFDEAWNFGPIEDDVKSVEWITNSLLRISGVDLFWEPDNDYNPHEAQALKLDISKANKMMDWTPRWNIEHSLLKVVEWHKEFNRTGNTESITNHQILEYLNDE